MSPKSTSKFGAPAKEGETIKGNVVVKTKDEGAEMNDQRFNLAVKQAENKAASAIFNSAVGQSHAHLVKGLSGNSRNPYEFRWSVFEGPQGHKVFLLNHVYKSRAAALKGARDYGCTVVEYDYQI